MRTASSTSERETFFFTYILIIFLPFLLFYWMMPFLSSLTLGADYPLFSINEQIEIFFSVKNGSFPLYVPGYKFGHSSSALTLGQAYHPISHIASLLPGYWNGKALEWNTFLRLLSLGLTNLLLFAFLKKIRVNTLFSFLISLITVYNLRMLEAFRYGASLEAYTGNLLLCTLIGWYFISPSRWFGPLCIIGAAYMLVCSGHPPMMFYGVFGAGVFTLVAPFFLATILPERDINCRIALRFWIRIGLYVFLGILLSSAYILPFYSEFVTKNVEYVNIGLQSHMGQDTLVGALNNFFMPLVSDALSTFGGSSLIIMTLLLPLLLCFRVRIPSAVWAVWCIILFAFLYILGPATPVFRWAWEYLPFVSSAGGVGRISIIIPSLMLLLLIWIVSAETFKLRFKSLSATVTPYTLLGLISFVLIPLYLLPVFLLKPTLGFFTPHYIRKLPFWIELISVALGMLSLAALVLYGMYPRLARRLGILLCLMILLHVGTLLKYGTFIEKKYDKPTFEQIANEKKEKLDFIFRQNPSMFHVEVLSHIKRSFVEPFLGRIYTQVVPVESREDAYRKMEQSRLPQQVFVEGYNGDKAKKITEGAEDMKEGRVELIYSSYNRLQFKVVSQSSALFGLSYPYTGHWSARVNGEESRVYRANGAAHAVEIPQGESLIDFRYWSDAFFWGMMISCTTFAVIGLVVCFCSLIGLRRIIGILLVLTVSAGVFMLWYDSLYSGDNLNTEYSWHYSPPEYPVNIAYGKRAYTLNHGTADMQYPGSKAVDGDTTPGSGFLLEAVNRFNEAGDRNSLFIDLNKNEAIGTIKLFGRMNTRPLLSLSQDGNQWNEVAPADTQRNSPDLLRVKFGKPQIARYVKIHPVHSESAVDEVEIYRFDN